MAAKSILSIDAKGSREIQAVLLAMRQTDRTIAKAIRQQQKAVIGPEWTKGVESRVSTPEERVILGATARVAVSDGNVALRSGGTNATLSGGLSTREPTTAPAVEFGANRDYTKTYLTRSRKGNKFEVKRHTQRQLTKSRKKGPVYKTAENIVPRVAALWVATTVKVLHEAAEGNVL
jgi:hypothetical protein